MGDTNSAVRDGIIGHYEHCGSGVDNFFELSRDIPFVEFVLLNTTRVGEPRCVEDANVWKRSGIIIMLKCYDAPLCCCCSEIRTGGPSWFVTQVVHVDDWRGREEMV